MIEINLVPAELRKKERRESALGAGFSGVSRLSQVRLLVIFAASLVAVQAILFALQFSERFHLSRLQKQSLESNRKRAEVDKVKGSLEAISGKVPSIDQIMSGRIKWARTLNALSDAVTPGVWLTGLSYDERALETAAQGAAGARSSPVLGAKKEPVQAATRATQAFLTLTGRAYGTSGDLTAIIGKFIKSLKAEKGFSSTFANIAVEDIKGEKFEGQEVMYFRIVCSSKR